MNNNTGTKISDDVIKVGIAAAYIGWERAHTCCNVGDYPGYE